MKSRIILLLTVLVFSRFILDSRVGAQDIVIAHPGQDVELPCDVTGAGVIAWQINGSSPAHILNDLFMGVVAGHNISGNNILVEDIMMNDVRNGSQYRCVVLMNRPDPNIEGNLTILYVAGVPNKVPIITVDNITISNNGSNVTLTLSWGEPFNNLDPILNYTVSCSGDDTCPQDFTTTDSTTRSYNITNLIPMTDYTFSVVATNSIGDSENYSLNYTTEAIDQVMGVDLTCGAEKFNNLCNVTWNQVTQDDIIEYQVYYNETMRIVNSSTTMLTFTAPLLPDDMFTGTVVVTVAAISTLGVGPSSIDTAEINGSSVTNVTVTGSFNVITRLTTNTSDTDVYISYTIAVTDIISLNISNMTLRTLLEGLLSNMTSLMLSPRENSTFSNSFNLSIELSNTNFTTADIVIADIVNVTVVEIEEKYNISVTCDIHPESMADMCMVVAIGTDNNITKGSATVDSNVAVVILTGLNCGTEYTIIAEGMRNGNSIGLKSSYGPILDYLCELLKFVNPEIFEPSEGADCEAGCIVGISLGGASLVGGSVVLIAIVWYKKDGNKKNASDKSPEEDSASTDKSSEEDSELCNQLCKFALFFILGVLTCGITCVVWFILKYRADKVLCNQRRKFFILGVLTCGISCVVLKCKADKDVQPDKVEMQSGDVYASPKKKEIDAEATSTDQGLYSYARTGPINVLVPGGKP